MQLFFSQGIAVLCSEPPDLASVRMLLERGGFSIVSDADNSGWMEMEGPRLTLALSSESQASCWVDICDFGWPDDLGTIGEPTQLTSASALGGFGPFANPGALTRASEAPRYREGAVAASDHRAFVRVRITHFFPIEPGRENDAKREPNAREEFVFALRVAAALGRLSEARAYFNPNSEMLLTMEALSEIMEQCAENRLFPVGALCRFRGCPVEDGWSFVDSIGLPQLDLPDHEFAWYGDEPSRADQIEFLFSFLQYQIEEGVSVGTRHTTDGPGGVLWRAEERDNSCMVPPRKVIHWQVEGAAPEPAALAAAAQPHDPNHEESFDDVTRELIHKLDAWLPLKATMRERAVAWVCSEEFLDCYYDDAHVPFAMKFALEQECSKKEARETWSKLQHLGQQSPALWQEYQKLCEKGEIWFAVPVMANPAFKSAPDMLLPCGLIVAAEQTSLAIAGSHAFAGLAYGLYAEVEDKKAYPKTARIVGNDEYRMFYRETFPFAETAGIEFIYMSVLLRKSWMPPDGTPFVPLLAMPGAAGAVIQIPWHVAMGNPAMPGVIKPGRFSEIGQLDRQADHIVAEEKRVRYSGFSGKLRRCWDIIVLICSVVFWISVAAGVVMAALRDK